MMTLDAKLVLEKNFGCGDITGKSKFQVECKTTKRGLDYFDAFNFAPAPAPATINGRINSDETIEQAAIRRSSVREMKRLLNEQPGSGLANKPLWATETGVPLRATVPETNYPLFVKDGVDSVPWVTALVSNLEGTPSFNSELAFYYLQDGGGPSDFTTGLRTFTGERGNGDPRHTGCQLAKIWGGSGYRGGDWVRVGDGTMLAPDCIAWASP